MPEVKADRAPGEISTGRPAAKIGLELWQDAAPERASGVISRDLRVIANPLAARVEFEVGVIRSAVDGPAAERLLTAPEAVSENRIFDAFPDICGCIADEPLKERGAGSCGDHLVDLDALLDLAAERLSLGFDTRPGNLPDRGDNTTPPRRRLPPRIEARPRVEDWPDDALMTLPEAAALFWPSGPLSTHTLRTAGRDGTLKITRIAGKFYTTPMAIRWMGIATGPEAGAQTKPDDTSAQASLQRSLDEARTLATGRTRRKRSTKKPVGDAESGKSRR